MIRFGTGGWRAIIGDEFTRENVRLLAQDGRVEVSASVLGLDAAAAGGAAVALERVLADPLLAPPLPAGTARA